MRIRAEAKTASRVFGDLEAASLAGEVDALMEALEDAERRLMAGELLPAEIAANYLKIHKWASRELVASERGKAAARRVLGRRLPI